ncbi:MAG: HIT family protein [Salinivirgaceae bacterium]|nr:HIT family protein [Salinivirgaceae bacterium]MDD4745838.1 HIT family protein [Salinivirgaceae bacterium]MDY0280240.1 HIT family protein [Salinivirgaceae bacterium]
MSSIFTKIINGEIPSFKVEESNNFVAFLDAFPLKEGHTLIVPKREVDDYFDLTDQELGEMVLFSKRIAKAIKLAFPCEKVSVSVIGLEVPHAHMHLIPINTMDECNFANKKLKIKEQRMLEICSLIKGKLTN